MRRVTVIDYGMGNLHSVAKALEHAGAGHTLQVDVSHDHALIKQADHVVLPGVGAMRDCMGEIKRLGIDSIVHEVINAGIPLLGVCVGMQALFGHSQENNGVDCMGIFPGEVCDFRQTFNAHHINDLKIPHMGWNQVKQTLDHPLWQDIAQNERFYFVHSFYAKPEQSQHLAGTSDYGFEFCAAIAHANVFATQFHPEKSQHAGLQLYKNFLNWDGQI